MEVEAGESKVQGYPRTIYQTQSQTGLRETQGGGRGQKQSRDLMGQGSTNQMRFSTLPKMEGRVFVKSLPWPGLSRTPRAWDLGGPISHEGPSLLLCPLQPQPRATSLHAQGGCLGFKHFSSYNYEQAGFARTHQVTAMGFLPGFR